MHLEGRFFFALCGSGCLFPQSIIHPSLSLSSPFVLKMFDPPPPFYHEEVKSQNLGIRSLTWVPHYFIIG